MYLIYLLVLITPIVALIFIYVLVKNRKQSLFEGYELFSQIPESISYS